MKALVFGEILWDIIEGEPHLGGAPLNFASHMVQCGQSSTIISCLGIDELGNEAYQMIEEMRVDASMIQRSEVRTGFVPVTLKNGQPDYEITKEVAYDYIDAKKLDHHAIADFDLFYFGSLIQRSPVSEKALYEILDKHPFVNIVYDVNLRKDCFNQTIIENSLRYCTILKLNNEEVSVLSNMLFGEKLAIEAFGRLIKERFENIQTMIVTAGSIGCHVFHDNKLSTILTKKIKVADTVGAGDAFGAAYLSALNQTGDPIQAAGVANEVGGFVASSHGPLPKYPPDLKEKISSLK